MTPPPPPPPEYQPPTDTLKVLCDIDVGEALADDDPRYVPTTEARGGERTMAQLARKLGLSLADGSFHPATTRHILFFGHTGSGKSTELRRYAAKYAGDFSGKRHIFYVEMDVNKVLDRNNVKYADIVMAMAKELCQRLMDEGVDVTGDPVRELQECLANRVLSSTKTQELSAEINTKAQGKLGIPWLVELFAGFTAGFKTNASYKEELRSEIRNHFTPIAEAFNRFLRAVETALNQRGLGQRILFLVDGTDKLRMENVRQFFIEDAEQLAAIEALVIYAAPIALKYEGGLAGKLDADLILAMVKLAEEDGQPFDPGLQAMRAILLRRADRSLFADEAVIDKLVDHSGGHPRELLRLLKLCCEYDTDNRIDDTIAERALDALAADYRYFLTTEDYQILAAVDGGDGPVGSDAGIQRLLYNLALLQYNAGAWRRTHPIVRRLKGYQQAMAAQAAAKAAAAGAGTPPA